MFAPIRISSNEQAGDPAHRDRLNSAKWTRSRMAPAGYCFAPLGLLCCQLPTRGLRRGLHSCTASRLGNRHKYALSSVTARASRFPVVSVRGKRTLAHTAGNIFVHLILRVGARRQQRFDFSPQLSILRAGLVKKSAPLVWFAFEGHSWLRVWPTRIGVTP